VLSIAANGNTAAYNYYSSNDGNTVSVVAFLKKRMFEKGNINLIQRKEQEEIVRQKSCET